MQQAVLGSYTSQEISCIHYSVHITRILTTVLSRMNPIYHKFNLVSEFDGINQKAAQPISQLVDSNPSNFMSNPINMSHISVHSASRQAPWIFSILDRYHSISGLENNQILQSASMLPLWKQMLTSQGFCTNSTDLKQLDASALFLKACHFLPTQKLHWMQHMVTLHSNACHNFEINNKQPRRFYSTATNIMSSLLTAVVVVGRVWQVTA